MKNFMNLCLQKTFRSGVVLVLAAGLLPLATPLRAVPTNSPPRVLIMDETVVGGISSEESLAAQAAIPGVAVDVCSAANWYGIPATGTGGPTGYGFDQYRAIIIGDPTCQVGSNYMNGMTALNATKLLWTPACSGNVIIMGVDNALHAGGSATNGPGKTLYRGIAFAANDPTKTGFYYAMSCYYDYGMTMTTNALLVPHLTGFGTFMVVNYGGTCFDAAHMVATHPIFTNAPALNDAALSNWGCSTHEGFSAWPPSFVVLAIALTNGVYTAADGSNGVPYIIVRGEGVKVLSPIEISPGNATNDLGTPHTVCASIATNIIPYANVPVTFTISSGPNSVTNHVSVTGSNGVACFTYTGNGGLGTDYITASFMNNQDKTITSGVSTKIWVGACVNVGCDTVECLSSGNWTYKFCVKNLTGGPITTLALMNPPAGVSLLPNVFTFSPPLASGQSTNLSIFINGPAALTNLCFKFGASSNAATLGCSIPRCIPLPACCNRILTNSLVWNTTIGGTNYYTYSITIQNVTASPIKFVGFAAVQTCVKFLPPLLDLTLPAYGTNLLMPGQTRTLNLQVLRSSPCPGTNEFYLSSFDTNFIACCSTKAALPPAKCVKIWWPVYDSVFARVSPLTFTVIPIGPCGLVWVKFYDGATFLGDAQPLPTGAFELALPNGFDVVGEHYISATAQLESGTGLPGEIETSEPVRINILDPYNPPGGHDH